MKRIMKGQLYDTQKSEIIVEWEKEIPSDGGYCFRGIYIAPKGNFFEAYKKGEDTGMRLLKTGAEILAFAEDTGETTFLEKYFPELIEEA
jgi:hypothetical protein